MVPFSFLTARPVQTIQDENVLALIKLEGELSDRIGETFRETGRVNTDLVKTLENARGCIWNSTEINS